MLNPAAWATGTDEQPVVHHELSVALDADAGTLAITDRIEPRAGPEPQSNEWLITLNRGFDVSVDPGEAANGARLDPQPAGDDGPLRRYRARPAPDRGHITLRYAGSPLFDPVSPTPEPGPDTPGGELHIEGHISPDGIHLNAAHAWYPRVVAGEVPRLVTFKITVTLPGGWTAVTQGATARDTPQGVSWSQIHPQPDIHLLAGPYAVTRRTIATTAGPIEAATYLLAPDEAIAAAYLDAAERYLPFYSELLGAYPYSTFSLVENRRQTGFGMPGFTLLGSRVIRLPFIPYTSYPHEIVHNWFGNGVYVDSARANWSEGLTAYLADHLSAERRAQGSGFRRRSLAKYRNHTHEAGRAKDEHGPARLADFRGRHDNASAAVGYDKALMVFHAIRRRLGDEVFFDALRRFYTEHRFQTAGFDELRRAFESSAAQSGTPMPLGAFFDQWLNRPDAPALELRDTEILNTEQGHRVRGTLVQVQGSDPFDIDVPVAIHMAGGDIAWHEVAMRDRVTRFDWPVANAPTHLDVDPLFDVPRRLALGELPPSLAELFSARASSQSLSGPGNDGDTPSQPGAHYASLAALLNLPRRNGDGSRPPATWIFGFDHPDVPRFLASAGQGELARHAGAIEILGQRYSVAEHCFALAARDSGGRALGWLVCEPGTDERGQLAAAGMTRLLHYGSAGYVVTPGTDGKRATYGEWAVQASPLGRMFDASAPRGTLPPRAPTMSPGE